MPSNIKYEHLLRLNLFILVKAISDEYNEPDINECQRMIKDFISSLSENILATITNNDVIREEIDNEYEIIDDSVEEVVIQN